MCCRLASTTGQTLQIVYSQGLSATLWLFCALPPMTHSAPFELQTSAEPASQTSLAAVYRFSFLHLSLFLSIRLVLQQTFMSHQCLTLWLIVFTFLYSCIISVTKEHGDLQGISLLTCVCVCAVCCIASSLPVCLLKP